MVSAKKRFTIEDWILMLLLADLALYLAACLVRNVQIRHLITVVGTVSVWALVAIRSVQSKFHLTGVVSFVVLVLLILVNALGSGTLRVFDYVYSALCFLGFFMIFASDVDYRIHPRMRTFIRIFALLFAAEIIVLSLSPVAYRFEDNRTNGTMALGMTNSNLAGIIVFLIYSVLFICMTESGRKLIYIPFLLYLAYVIFASQCRSAYLATAFVTVFGLLKKKRFHRAVVAAFLALPLLFLVIYLMLYNSGSFSGNVMLFGKPLFSGREVTYREVFAYINTVPHLVFGNLASTYFLNAHNGPLVVLSSLGIIGLLFTYLSISIQLMRNDLLLKTKVQICAFCAILALFIISSSEGVFFMGVFPGIGFVLLIQLLERNQVL